MFEGLLSNNRLKSELTKSVSENKPMHAYLFCGADGSGKMTAAKLLAKELVGTNKDKADRDSHPDIIVIAPEKGKKLISVEQVRNMRSDAFINPSEGTRKIYIIDGIHLMNDAGQNALLTILEQPPSFAIFILLSESREKVLSTVISRCTVFEMEYVSAEEGAEFLQKQLPDISYNKLLIAMSAAEGNIGFAKKLVSKEDFDRLEKMCLKIALSAANKDDYTIAKILTMLTKDELLELLPILSMYLRDIVVCKLSGGTNIVFKESVLQNKTNFDKIDINILYDCIKECETAIEMINSSVNVQLISAALVMRFCGGKRID